MKNLGLSTLFVNFGGTLTRQLVALGLQLGFSVLVARSLGPEGNGVYSVVLLFATTLHVFLDFGVTPANIYFVSRGSVSVRQSRRTILKLSVIFSVVGIILISALLLGDWKEQLFPGVPTYFLWVSVVIFPVHLIQVWLASFLSAKQDFYHYNLMVLIPPIISLVGGLLLVVWAKWSVWGAILVYLLGQVVCLFATWRAVSIHIENPEEDVPVIDYTKELLNYGWKAHLSNIVAFANYRVDTYLINFLLNPAATGVYTIAVQFAERIWMLSKALSAVLLPRLAELDSEEEKRKLLTPLVSRWVLMTSVLGSVALAVLAKPLITFLYGPSYQDAINALLWLLPGIVMSSFSRILANDIAARGRPELNLITSVLTIIVNVVAILILVPVLGISGGSIASTLAYTINAILKIFLYMWLSKNAWYEIIVMGKNDWELIKRAFCLLRERLSLFLQSRNV